MACEAPAAAGTVPPPEVPPAAASSGPKKVLVTGGSGLVGHGIRLALERGSRVDGEEFVFARSADVDLTNWEDTLNYFRRVKPTHVIHLAANVGGLFKNLRYPVEMFRDNIAINDNVMRACHDTGVEHLVSCLSTCILPDKTTYPITEAMLHDGPPHDSNAGYAYAKRMIDVMNRAYFKQHKRRYTAVIPTNVFGPYDNFHLEDSHVLPGLMHKALLARKEGRPLPVMGTGAPLRQFIYSVDLGRLMLWVMREYREVDPIILSVGADAEVSIKDVAEMVAKFSGVTQGCEFDTTKADGQYRKTASNAKLMKYLPDFKFTPIDVALKETVDWFNANYETCRK